MSSGMVSHAERESDSHEKGPRVTDRDLAAPEAEPALTARRFMSFVAMAFLWTGSQIPVYLFGGVPPLIYRDLGGEDRWVWFVTGNLLGLAGVCPFVGALSDLLGRRHVAVVGLVLVMVGQVVASTALSMNTFIAGMVISGVGAGISELTALAGTAELAPTSKRGTYVAVLIATIFPFCPSVMWAQLISAYASWRYIGILTAGWSFLGLLCVLFFYFPPPRVNSLGLSTSEIVERIDFLGGFLSVAGVVLFVAGMLWGGYQVGSIRSAFLPRPYPYRAFTLPCLLTRVLLHPVRLDQCAHSRASLPRPPSPRPLRLLGDLGRQVPHVPATSGPSDLESQPDLRHHLHLRRQLLLGPDAVADAGLQRLRS